MVSIYLISEPKPIVPWVLIMCEYVIRTGQNGCHYADNIFCWMKIKINALKVSCRDKLVTCSVGIKRISLNIFLSLVLNLRTVHVVHCACVVYRAWLPVPVFGMTEAMSKQVISVVLLCVVITVVRSQSDRFDEELFVRPLQSGHVYSHFQFTTRWDVDQSDQLACKLSELWSAHENNMNNAHWTIALLNTERLNGIKSMMPVLNHPT